MQLQKEKVREAYKLVLLQLILYLLRLSEGYNLYNQESIKHADHILRRLQQNPPRVRIQHLIDFLYHIVTQETSSAFETYFNLDIFRFLIVRSMDSEGIIDGAETLSKRIACLHYLIRGIILLTAEKNR
jgi:hypothetical protein